MSNPTKAEALCYQAFANILHLQHQLASVINNEEFENAFSKIENALDRLNSTTIMMEAHEEAKMMNERPITFCHECQRYQHQIEIGGCSAETCPNPVNTYY